MNIKRKDLINELDKLKIRFSNLKQSNEDLEATINYLDTLQNAVDNAVSAIAITDNNNDITYVNSAFIKMFEYDNREEIIGKNASILFPANEISSFTDINRLINNSIGYSSEFIVTKKDKTEFFVEALFSNIVNSRSVIIGRMVSLINISKRKTIQKRTEEFIKKLETSLIESEKSSAHMDHEFNAAAKFISSLLPTQKKILNIKFEYIFQPSYRLGGDFIFFSQLTERYVIVYQFDVSGHGLRSSLYAGMIYKTLSDMKPDILLCPKKVMSVLNDTFKVFSPYFFTMFYGVIDCHEQMIDIAVSGQNGVVFQPYERNPYMLDMSSIPIGLIDDFTCFEARVSFKPKDRIFLFSDGIVEAKNKNSELFEEKNVLLTILANTERSCSGILDVLLNNAIQWQNKKAFKDDVTLAAIEFE